ncbi:MAG TPA: CPBP family glutamic-type intramembrane protease, partial [Ktedonobacteraceae bacterium]|nr:CPBP family glutamic-type intramembrane protease [Ktedonobacteraceae bacterium]
MGGLPGLCGVIKDQSAAHRQQDFGGGGLLHVLPACFPSFWEEYTSKVSLLHQTRGSSSPHFCRSAWTADWWKCATSPLSTWTRLPQAMRTSFPIPALWKRFLACFYGGIAEELLCRLFLLSLLAWLIGLAWHVPGGKPTPGALWLATILAAVIFGLGHLPTTASLVKLTPLLIVRTI